MTPISETHFREALLDPKANRPAGLTDGQGRAAGRRFDVYRNNVAVSLTEALETAFPTIAKLVGAQNFKTLAGTFLRAHPPSSPMMMFYGTEMPAFLAAFPPTQSLKYLPDVARLELALRESYHAADCRPIDPGVLQTLPTDQLMVCTLSLAPSLRVITSEWPVLSIWRFNNVAGAPKPAMQNEDVVVLRREMDPELHLLPRGGAAFLACVNRGETFADALEASTGRHRDFDLTALLGLLLSHGAITGLGDPR